MFMKRYQDYTIDEGYCSDFSPAFYLNGPDGNVCGPYRSVAEAAGQRSRLVTIEAYYNSPECERRTKIKIAVAEVTGTLDRIVEPPYSPKYISDGAAMLLWNVALCGIPIMASMLSSAIEDTTLAILGKAPQ